MSKAEKVQYDFDVSIINKLDSYYGVFFKNISWIFTENFLKE